MNREEIIKLAREAGFVFANHTAVGSEENLLQNFAALVAAAEREKCYEFIEILIDAEREACAQILDSNAEACKNNSMLADVLAGNALAIRARGEELSSQDNLPKLPTGRYICHVCNSQEMVRAKFDEESG